ncbi:MAG: hypothetical protein JSV04_00175 [Candidatus Heimdallarchaeota archaeon]|nr:MAG: hypothetical protein JSV04_00175 [Candidatus Heimdallarchaeota archaeon]
MNLIKIYQDGANAYLRGDYSLAISHYQSLLKEYIFYYANTHSMDTVSYTIDSILVLQSKVWLHLVQTLSTQKFQSQLLKYHQQLLLQAQGLLAGVDILMVYLRNKYGFTQHSRLGIGFKSLETIQKILKRKTERWSLS